MTIAAETVEEIIRTYQSGKNGIVLEMVHRQEWMPVLRQLRGASAFSGKVFYEIRYGNVSCNGQTRFRPAVYQCLSIPRQIQDTDYGLEGLREGDYYPAALGRLLTGLETGGVVVSDFHLLPAETQRNCMLYLTRCLSTGEGGTLVLLTVSDGKYIPEALLPYVQIIPRKRPGIEEIQDQVRESLQQQRLQLSERFQHEIVSYLQGFQRYEIDYIFAMARRMYGEDAYDEEKKKILEWIGQEKVKMLERDRLLEWNMVRHVDMANMENLSEHLRNSGRIISALEDAVENGVDVPKGILIMGLPGTGKSLFAQYAAALLQMPLIRLEMGRMMGGYVGDSERNLRTAQAQAEAMAPCILWIDEIEKGFAGAGNIAREDSGYLQRMTGGFLTWLQEKKNACYIIATANSIDGLPAEFFRKGRFDECFYTSMPTERELQEILRVHLLKEKRKHVEASVEPAVSQLIRHAAGVKKFMTGADAGTLVSNVFRRMYLDFQDQTELRDKHQYDREHLTDVLIAEFDRLKVFSQTNALEIARFHKSTQKSGFVPASVLRDSDGYSRYNNALQVFISDTWKNIEERKINGQNA